MSWIALDDLVGGVRHVLGDDALSGPVNFVSPSPVTNAEFTHTLGRVLGRPTAFTVPAFAIRFLLGEMGEEMLLAGARALPRRLQQSGYTFALPELDSALREMLTRFVAEDTSAW